MLKQMHICMPILSGIQLSAYSAVIGSCFQSKQPLWPAQNQTCLWVWGMFKSASMSPPGPFLLLNQSQSLRWVRLICTLTVCHKWTDTLPVHCLHINTSVSFLTLKGCQRKELQKWHFAYCIASARFYAREPVIMHGCCYSAWIIHESHVPVE